MYRRAAVHALYLSLSLLFASRFFPLTHPTSHAITDGDPALACWIVQWVSHAIVHDPLHWYAGNTFHPYARSITLSDPMVSLAVLNLPVRLFASNPWVGYNLLIVLAYYWSCVSGAALARLVTGSEAAAMWGAMFWGFLFYRVHQIGHLQILSFQWIPAAVVCLVHLWQRPTARRALLLAVTFAVQALVSWYLAVVLAAVLAIVAATQPWRAAFARRPLQCYALAASVVAAIVLPFAWPYRTAFDDTSLAARKTLVDTFGDAVHLRDYLMPPVSTLAGSRMDANPYTIWGENTLYVGYVPLALSAAALLFALTGGVKMSRVVQAFRPAVSGGPEGPHYFYRDSLRWTLTGLALVVAGYALALGFVSPSLGIRLPLHYLARVFPMLAGLRAPQRLSLVLYTGVLVLSSIALAQIVRRWRPRTQLVAAAVVCIAFLCEVFPVNLPISAAHPYSPSAPDQFIATYQKTRTEPLVVLHLPIYYFREAYPTDEATYMLDSTWHWARILNGFSGAEPAGFLDRMRVLNTLPDPAAVALLRELRVDVVAVHGSAARTGDTLRDYFSRQEWSSIVPLPNGEFLVLVDWAKARTISIR